MRRSISACVAMLVCGAGTGCPGWPGGRLIPVSGDSEQQSLRPQTSPGGFEKLFQDAVPEGLYVESMLLERPVGDSFLDRQLWTEGRTPLPAETEALLSENGLRAVVLGGNLPHGFQTLIQSETDAVNPHLMTFANRKEAVLPTAGPFLECSYHVLSDLAGEPVPVRLEQARGGILVRPSLAADGRIRLQCEPRVQYGERQDWLQPTLDGTQFIMRGGLPVEQYPDLGFEILLAEGEYLVIGWPAAAGETLGSALFSAEASGRARQRVLVIRAGWRGASPNGLISAGSESRRPSIAREALRP